MTINSISKEIGVDTDVIDVNFGGKISLYLKCINLFSKYDFLYEIENALNDKNYKLLENKAHALKGVAANLGFKQLLDLSSNIVNSIRNNSLEDIPALFKYLKIEYGRIIKILSEY